MQYKIYEEFFGDVEKKLKRIEKKCAKHGNPFTFNVVGTEIKEVVDEETRNKRHYKFMVIEVEGTAKINDYECVAVLENHEFGNVIRRINTEIEIPERFLSTDNICEHCNSKRPRKELYIIHNTKTDEFKQVGSSCLMLYTNGLNAEYVASYIDGITELEEFDGFIGGGAKYYIPVDEVIEYATEIINKIGYFNSNSNLPTKYLVGEMVSRIGSFEDKIEKLNEMLTEHKFAISFNKADFHKDDTEETAKKIIDYYVGLENGGEFINNVQVILKDGYVEWHNLGFLCYLPEGYFKYIQKEIEKAKRIEVDEKSNHFGEVGKRYKDINVYRMEMLTCFDTQYGCMYIYKIVLDSGDILIWKTSNWVDDYVKAQSITFTVKEHSEYKGIKQTEVTRCKVNIKE